MERFILIDGNAILHRAYHALPPLNNKDGQLTNAVYGFFSMFLKIFQDQKPNFVAVCFDRPKPTFRKTLYVGYQAKRPKMDDELVPQIGMVHEVLEKAGVSIFEVDGYEADDLIGTLADQIQKSKLKSQNLEVIIVSGDRDMLQLVNSHVKVLAPIIGITNMILFDGEKVEERYGIKPQQIVDYKALVGDASDNYPGVSGIGPKTAKGLLQKYETLENIYEHIGELSEKEAKKLSIDAEQAALAKKLATIVVDAPVSLDLNKCNIAKFNTKNLIQEFGKLGFKSLIKRIQGNEKPATTRPQTPEALATGGQAEIQKKTEVQEEKQQLGLL